MMRRYSRVLVSVLIAVPALMLVVATSKSWATEWSTGDAQRTATISTEAGPSYESDGRLRFPARYREWIFLSSGIDMAYSKGVASSHAFDNVFVEPTAYREFMGTGTWPDGTQLVLETRAASEKGSINQRGRFQAGQPLGLQVHVKDTKRFKGSWAFFSFENRQPAVLISVTEDCYDCHQAHGAVDTTFVQFYPTLLAVASQKRVIKPGVDVLIVVPPGSGRSRAGTAGTTTGSTTTNNAATKSATGGAAQPHQ